MLMAGSATVFGRREFIGPFRLQLMHMKMNRACQVNSFLFENIFSHDQNHSESKCVVALWSRRGAGGGCDRVQQDGQGQAVHGGEGHVRGQA